MNKKVAAGKTSQQGPMTTPTVRQSEDVGWASVTFVVPLSSERPAPSIEPVFPSVVQPHASELQAAAPGSSAPFFTNYHVPENQSDTAAEAIRQANVMMERMKTVHEHSQAANHASAALRANVQVSKLSTDLVLLGYATRNIFFHTISYCLRRICTPTGCFVVFGICALPLGLGE